jgi:hypothetical protein
MWPHGDPLTSGQLDRPYMLRKIPISEHANRAAHRHDSTVNDHSTHTKADHLPKLHNIKSLAPKYGATTGKIEISPVLLL